MSGITTDATPDKRRPWDIARDGLCVRCGACFDLCPHSLIEPDAQGFPSIRPQRRRECTECGLCMRPCPGDVDFPSLYTAFLGRTPVPLDAVGVLRGVYVAHSTDAGVRARGASGGVVTELLRQQLRQGRAERALVCGMNRDRPWLAEPWLASTEDEILAATQSKYTLQPQLARLGRILRERRPTAIVGLPCHVHAVRKMQAWNPKLTEPIRLVVGIACNSALEPAATRKLLEVSGVRPDDVARLEYRGGEWPGGVQATLKNGRIARVRSLDIKATFNYATCFYTPPRCLMCIDYGAELADVIVADPWIRDASGNHPYRGGWSLMLVRTEAGEQAVAEARQAGALHVEAISPDLLPSQFDSVARYKKTGAAIRIAQVARRGLPTPQYKLDFPAPDWRARLGEWAGELKRLPSRWAWSRDLGMRLAFSWLGDRLMRWRTAAKIRASARRAACPPSRVLPTPRPRPIP